MTKTSIVLAALVSALWYGIVVPFILLWCFNTLFPALAVVYTYKVMGVLALAAVTLTVKLQVSYK